MKPLKLNQNNFENEVSNSDKPVLIDFYADWCGPCRMLGPVIEELAGEVSDAKICKINVDEEEELASKFGVMSIPTVVVIKDNKVVNKSVGYQSKEKLLAMLSR